MSEEHVSLANNKNDEIFQPENKEDKVKFRIKKEKQIQEEMKKTIKIKRKSLGYLDVKIDGDRKPKLSTIISKENISASGDEDSLNLDVGGEGKKEEEKHKSLYHDNENYFSGEGKNGNRRLSEARDNGKEVKFRVNDKRREIRKNGRNHDLEKNHGNFDTLDDRELEGIEGEKPREDLKDDDVIIEDKRENKHSEEDSYHEDDQKYGGKGNYYKVGKQDKANLGEREDSYSNNGQKEDSYHSQKEKLYNGNKKENRSLGEKEESFNREEKRKFTSYRKRRLVQ
jgi:hypothetical protein